MTKEAVEERFTNFKVGMKIGLFSVNVFIEVEIPVDLGSSCGHCLINEEVKGHRGSFTRRIVSKIEAPRLGLSQHRARGSKDEMR